MFIPALNRKLSWQDCTLIVPAVSVGNVGQLAADLIISTLWMERVGYIQHPSLLPVVGNNPFAHEDATSCKITTCCEVYESIIAQVVVIQQRAPFIKGKRKDYADWLSNWIKQQNFYQVVILTGSYAQERLDHQISGSPFRILMSEKMKEKSGQFFSEKMLWKELEPRKSLSAPAAGQTTTGDVMYMPGSGIAKKLFEDCSDLSTLVLMMFVSEGDNAQDAFNMAEGLNGWLTLLQKKDQKSESMASETVAKGIIQWKVPMSWRLVYGSRFDQKLFH